MPASRPEYEETRTYRKEIVVAAASAAILATVLLCLGLSARSSASPVARLVALEIAAFAPWAATLVALRRGAAALVPGWAVVVAALVLRLVLVPSPATLSDDVNRYVWDGRVLLHGVNPYRHAPDAEELAGLRDDTWLGINNRDLRTIYPPLAEILFAGVAIVWPRPVAYKTMAAVADTAVTALVLWLAGGRLGRMPRSSPARDVQRRAVVAAAAYGLCPLPCVESGMSGHVDAAAVAATVAAILCMVRGRDGRAGLLLSCGFGLKLAPVLLWPLAARRDVRALVAFPIAAAAMYLLFLAAGSAAFETLDAYARRWEGNAGLFEIVKRGAAAAIGLATGDARPEAMIHMRILDTVAAALQGTFFALHKDGAFDPAAPGAFPASDLALAAAKIVLGLALATVIAVVVARRTEPLRGSLWILGTLVVVSPVVHPWYLVWVLPLSAAIGFWPFFVMAALAPLAYLPLDGWWAAGVWELPGWIPILEHGAFFASAAACVAVRRMASRRLEVDPWSGSQ